MQDTAERRAKTIRIDDRVYHQARVAAVMSRKSLGQWLEGAILDKLDRESPATGSEAEDTHAAQA